MKGGEGSFGFWDSELRKSVIVVHVAQSVRFQARGTMIESLWFCVSRTCDSF